MFPPTFLFVISDIGKMHQKLSGGHIVLGIMNKSLMIAKQTETNITQNAFVLFRVEDIEDKSICALNATHKASCTAILPQSAHLPTCHYYQPMSWFS